MYLPVKGFFRLSALVCLGLMLGGCATTGTPNPADPLEPLNRGTYKFNNAIDRAALKPVARAYHDHTPTWLQAGVGHFFSNLGYPWTVANQLLQGKFVAAGQDTARFVINSTLGWAGIFDVASGANLPEHNEDLGQTLGKWGVPPGAYLMIPLLGPSTVRDLPSSVAERVFQPLYWFNIGNAKWGSLALSAVDTRSRLLAVDPTLDRVFDRYAFIRDAYLQRRQYEVYDGNPPEEPVDAEMQKLIDEADKESPPPK
jgi:phospholipid-binding lipoprotein MlaA